MGRFFAWTPDDEPGYVIQTTSDGDWAAIRDFYAPSRPASPALERIIEIAKQHQVRSVLVEQRYIDIDYRSEHSHFYSTTFARYPSVSHRLHFFSADISESDLLELDRFQDHYHGYSIMRPLTAAPVGRTMLRPPPDLDDATLCVAEDRVHVWGRTLKIVAMPFSSQDQQYLRCAHSSVWMMLYHAHLRHGLPRRLPHDIHSAAIGAAAFGYRQLPSEGLSAGQVVRALTDLGMSSGVIRLPQNEKENKERSYHRTLMAMVCRYVNSQMPPLVYSFNHAWVIVGHKPKDPGAGSDETTLYRHDDVYGPYLSVSSPWKDDPRYLPWRGLIPPLPQKVYMTGDRAEVLGFAFLRNEATRVPKENALAVALFDGRITLRSYAIASWELKERAQERLPDDVTNLYRFAHLPRWVWVVEAWDRDLYAAGKDCVLGEVLIDATSSHLATVEDDAVLAFHLAGQATLRTPDYKETFRVKVEGFDPYSTGRRQR